jgi:hypothetical protein
MATRIVTQSGRSRTLPEKLEVSRVAGLDEDGRIVVDDFDARNAQPINGSGWTLDPFMFGLTLCCNASDKGMEDGVYCRACYGAKPNADGGNYIYREADGSFPGLDPIAIVVTE